MKHQFIRITGILCFLLLAAAATAGTWSANNFFYQPNLGARGETEKNNFDTGLNRVDAHLARYKTLGDPGYSTLAEALTTIGSSKVTLTIPAGTVAITSNIIMGSNIALRIQNGGKFDVNSGVSLTINGTIDAGPYQIFSGSGTVNLGGVSTIYDVWYASPPTSPTSIAAPVGCRFVKTSGSPPLVYVKESGSGTSGWVASSGGSGANAFTGLNDVPSSYSGQGGKALRVNSSAKGLEFYSPSSSGGVKPFVTFGETGYATLTQALTTIGATETTMVIPAEAGVVSITTNTTIPANVDLRVLKGARFDVANGITLTINSPIEAGQYRIFSWTGTGTIDISASPTKDVYLQWWGAQAGKSNDVSSALAKAVASVGTGHVIRVSRGQWRIANPVVISPLNYAIRFRGDSVYDTVFYVDVGAGNTALTVGDPNNDEAYFEMADITFGGPPNCAASALVIRRVHHARLNRVNFWLGCSGYALDVQSCIWLTGEVFTRQACNDYGNYGECANGVRIASTTAPPYQTNALDLRVTLQSITGPNGVPLRLDGTGITNGVARLTGTIENYSGRPIYANGLDLLNIQSLYTEGSGTEALFQNCTNLSLFNCLIHDASCNLKFEKCQNVFLNNFAVYQLEISSDCRGVVVGSGNVWPGANHVKNYAPDTQFLGRINSNTGFGQKPIAVGQSADLQNIIYNSLFTRWKSDRPDSGWGLGNNTWTKCGSGQSDTTNHLTPYCAKVVTSGGDAWLYYAFDSSQLQRMLGQFLTYSLWAKFPTGQANLKSQPLNVQYDISVPCWAVATKYGINDAVKPVADGGKIYVCVTPGTTGSTEPAWPDKAPEWTASTSKALNSMVVPVGQGGGSANYVYKCITAGTTGSSQPAWPTDEGMTVVDGTAVWTCYRMDGYRINDGTAVWAVFSRSGSDGANIYQSSYMGSWYRTGLGLFVPNNATSVSLLHIVSRQSNGSEATCYLSEPTLMVGTKGPSAVIPNRDEHQQFINIGGNKIDFGINPPSAGEWCEKGDVRFNINVAAGGTPGWVCITRGTAGSSAMWKPMGNLGN